MMHDTRLARALMDERTVAAAAAAGTRGRASPLLRGRLGLARWMVRTGARLQSRYPVVVEGTVATLDAPKAPPTPGFQQAA